KSLSSKRLMLFLAYSGLMLMLTAPIYYMFRNVIILAFTPALFSLFLSIFNIQFFSIVQRDVDNEFLGRVFGIIFTVAILFMPLGTVFFSVVLNPNNTFNFFIIGVSITILSLIFSTLLKRYDRS
ncbi:TPA: macrolide ABC transporter permease, partial [Streptococcus pneumoniae]